MRRASLRRIGMTLAAPCLAILVALSVTSVVLVIVGSDPLGAVSTVLSEMSKPRIQVNVLNTATTYYLAAVAVAVAFKMNLFNIGVDGQYRLAAMLAAAVGGAVALPAPLHIGLIVVVAMAVGAAWAGVAALLRVTRGVSEVISTIMLNFIATAIVAYLLAPGLLAVQTPGSGNIGTRPIEPSGRVPGLALVPGAPNLVFGLIFLAIVVGVAYWFVLNRTRFGFELRATGMSATAAAASGIDAKRMVATTMLLSGAIAGLVGMPQLLGASYSYALDFPTGIGFTGIAIALLGRNSPVGITFAALLWAVLDNSANGLEFSGVPRQAVLIAQGIAVLSVVIAYELVRRYTVRSAAREIARELPGQKPGVVASG